MEQQLEQIRDQQKTAWDKFSPGWKKWDELTMNFLRPMGDEIIQYLKPGEKDIVLDVASGTGEPGLTIAAMVKNGKVISTDISDGMLIVCRENAAARSLTNFETKVCDVSELPFADNTFDAVSCRFGFMFFPDMPLAAKEIYRVLKPGGRFATAVWYAPEKNFWVTASMSAINRNLEIPPPSPEAPSMFRCGKPSFMKDLLNQAGFSNVSEKEVASRLNAKTADNYWNMMNEVAAPVVGELGKADDAMKEKIRTEVFNEIHKKYPDGSVSLEANALVIYGEKK